MSSPRPPEAKGGTLKIVLIVLGALFLGCCGLCGITSWLMYPKFLEGQNMVLATNDMKQIALGVTMYQDTHNHLPQPAICAADGTPLLSWRVAILPFIEQDALYQQFHLDEPWDSAHNKTLLAKMPAIYAARGGPEDVKAAGKTYFRVLAGPETPFDPDPKRKIGSKDITDGSSNTILFVMADEPVEWTKPSELKFDSKGSLPALRVQAFMKIVAMCDGSVKPIAATVPESDLRGAATRAGAEVLSAEWR